MENEKEKSTLKEEISNIGQIIVGELESIGGVLTGNATARAEGDLRADQGIIREELIHKTSDESDEEEAK